jgi:TonB family protein
VYDTRDLGRLVHGVQTGNHAGLLGLVDKLAAQVAAAMCTEPEFNPQNLCYDAPPRPKGAPLSVTDVPQPGETPPTPASFFVQVDSAGQVADVRVRTSSTHEDINAFAMAVVHQADYQPATKAGRAVSAWATVTVAVKGSGTARAVQLPAQCGTPGAYAAHLCYDTRPAALAAPTLPWHGEGAPPTPPTFWVRVSAAGDVTEVRPIATSSDDKFSVAAQTAAKDYKFAPAQKNGRPVEAWIQIFVSPAP